VILLPESSGKTDYMGAFCVTTGFGTDELAQEYEKANDDYNAIMVKALADRFAEAYAEFLHKKVRTEYWGYANQENLTNEELIAEKYKGIRPAPGYPACPDHLEKHDLGSTKSGRKYRCLSYRKFSNVPNCFGFRILFRKSACQIFWIGKNCRRPAERLCGKKRNFFAGSEKWLNPNLADGI
jgi:5-methyltetrahydrofolate--homocysteine methyltransferase